MNLAMMHENIRNLRKQLDGAVEARDAALRSYGFDSYESFLSAAVPRQPPRGILGWLRRALGVILPVRPEAAVTPGKAPTRYVPPRLMDLVQTHQFEIDALERRVRSLTVEIQKKFSIPTACLVFVLVGAPLGMRARKSGIGVVFLSILFFVFYWLCLAGGEELADRGLVAPWFAMWSPNLFIGAFGLLLTLQAAEIVRRPHRRVRRPRLRDAA
jgi:hypothetical protein